MSTIQNSTSQQVSQKPQEIAKESSKLDKVKAVALKILVAIGIIVGLTLAGALIGGAIGGVLGFAAGIGYGVTAGAAYVPGTFTASLLGFTILGGGLGTIGGLIWGCAVVANVEPKSDVNLLSGAGGLVSDAFTAGAIHGLYDRGRRR